MTQNQQEVWSTCPRSCAKITQPDSKAHALFSNPCRCLPFSRARLPNSQQTHRSHGLKVTCLYPHPLEPPRSQAPLVSPSLVSEGKYPYFIFKKRKKKIKHPPPVTLTYLWVRFFFFPLDHFLSFLPELLACNPPKLLIKEVKR